MSWTRPIDGPRSLLCCVFVLVLLVGGTWGGETRAQLVPVKTVPVATGSQFQLHPSHARGMGDVRLAVEDTLGDAFVNPATVARLDGTWAFSAPSHYTITGEDGGARTLSVGVLVNWGRWFGGIGGALQHLSSGSQSLRRAPFPGPRFATTQRPEEFSRRPLRETSAENQYLTLLGGRQLSDQWALAGEVRWAGLQAMEGVDLMYPGNQGLRQDGHRLDVRVGALREWGEQSLRVLLLHNRVDMQHDVRRVEYVESETDDEPMRRVRWERHHDRTNTWGLHLEYVRPLGSEGWRLGTVLTGNRKAHPKIPNYNLMNIPRDPGTSWASNVGVGVSHSGAHTTVGADLLFAPIVSETWANAQERIEQPNGGIILPGERTVVNDFTFANTTLRTGLRHRQAWWELQVGLNVRTIRYWLTQNDRVQQSKRDQYEDWSEWTLTWGGSAELGILTLRYTGDLTLGTGQPGVAAGPVLAAESAFASNFPVAPRGPLAVRESQVFTHQVSLILPIPGDTN
ncbi:MAG: hypothetical protein ABEL04_03540 [Salinibacter sp.]|uniref:hypothetical protein n=1 Tax=Salinibacter sp. TaxID=2065818 RepID=UPI0035D3EA8F